MTTMMMMTDDKYRNDRKSGTYSNCLSGTVIQVVNI